jgi:cytochrome c oxidase subunit 6b
LESNPISSWFFSLHLILFNLIHRSPLLSIYFILQIDTAPIDPRFPATNQARNCFVKYNEAHKCYAEKGEGAPECSRIARDYRSICPSEWLAAWNEARENGTWFGKY